MRQIEGVIFDMDGTLLDSEPTYRRADERFLRAQGIEPPEEVWESFVGIGSRNMIEKVKREFGLTGELEELLFEKDRHYRELAVEEMRPFPAALELLDELDRRSIPRAIATGSSSATLRFSLEVTGLADRFDAVVSTDEVDRGKPDPEVYLEAARRIGVAPENCLCLEDSLPGVRGGLAAGMVVVALPSSQMIRRDPLLDRAALVFGGGAEALEVAEVIRLIDGEGHDRAAG